MTIAEYNNLWDWIDKISWAITGFIYGVMAMYEYKRYKEEKRQKMVDNLITKEEK